MKKRIKELQISRDKWKEKYKKSNQEMVNYKTEIKSIKKKIKKILVG